MRVICVNHGDYLGRGRLYVERLRNMVARHLTIPHEFVCLTDKDLEHKGWWTKLELTRPGRFFGTVLYLDLDVIITGNIDHLVELAQSDKSKLWIRDDFSYSVINPKQGLSAKDKQYLGGDGCCNSSLMIWNGDALVPVWEAWIKDPQKWMSECHGDQNVISKVMWPNHIGLLPNDSIQSYKYGIRLRNEKPAPVVVFHGTPKPHELQDKWAVEHWR